MGPIASYREFAGRIFRAAARESCLWAIAWRPSIPFPAAVHDVTKAHRRLLNHRAIPAERIVFAGGSAGGGLALAALVQLRDFSVPLPVAAMCVSRLTDLAKESESTRTKAHLDPIVSYEAGMANARRYVGEGGDLKHPIASPLYAELAGLPPLLILVGTSETLLDDSTTSLSRRQPPAF